MTPPAAHALIAELSAAGVSRGTLVGVSTAPAIGTGLASGAQRWAVAAPDSIALIAAIEAELQPRWVWWGRPVPELFVASDVRPTACWDVGAVHQLLFGGARPTGAAAWAAVHDLLATGVPATGQLDLLGEHGDDTGDADQPVRPDGYLRPEWVSGGWRRDPDRLAAWAGVALACALAQRGRLDALAPGGDPVLTAWSESAAEQLCAELQHDGLPLDVTRAEELIAASAGRRPRDDADIERLRTERDKAVLAYVNERVDLRNPAQVKGMLTQIGVDVPDTRSWRLEPLRGTHPLIDALLQWRKAERIATTYGYAWLDANVRDGRLRGPWLGSDGAAGRMTAGAGLHNLPADLRSAVAAERGHVFVRADLGQIEPRVLAVVSGDLGLARAGMDDDLYSPVAARLGVARPIAKVAVLAAMYGQTSGTAGEALRGLKSAYPVAMRYLDTAYEDGRAGRHVRTHGGRLVRMGPLAKDLDEDGVRNAQGSRGRYARNAVIQGAAAEFFKIWAVTVRARVAPHGPRIVLCLHDELLMHVPIEQADATVELLRSCLAETARRWQAGRTLVRFVADVSVVHRWSEAKA